MLGVLGFAVCMRILTMQDQYIELTSSIPSSAILFGLGEYTSNVGFPLRRDGIPYTLWNRDQPPAVPNTNLYGSHPIILDVRDGEFMGSATRCHTKITYSSEDLFSSARHQYSSVQEVHIGLRYKAEGGNTCQVRGLRAVLLVQGGCAMA